MSFTDLLNAAPSGNEHAVRKHMPPAQFLAKLISASVYHRFWKANDKRATAECKECYAAQFEIVDYLPSGDEDKDRHILNQLEAFGDWRGFRPQPGYRKMGIPTLGADKLLAIAGVGDAATFPLIDTNETFDQFLGYSQEFHRFIEARQDGTLGGFVAKLSKRPDAMIPIDLPENPAAKGSLMKTIAATMDSYCIIELGLEENPEYGNRNFVAGVTSVG